MTLQVPAIADINPAGAHAPAGIAKWLRGIGFRNHTVFTALGDAVNVAARLQDMTKSLDCRVIVSEEVCRAAGIEFDGLVRRRVEIRGRVEPMTVFVAEDPTEFASLLDPHVDDPAPDAHVA